MKTTKHAELLNTKIIKQQQEKEEKGLNKYCNSCNVESIEIYKKCECRRGEDWGGYKYISGYFYCMYPKCEKDFGTIKLIIGNHLIDMVCVNKWLKVNYN